MPLTPEAIDTLTAQILWAVFALALAYGFVAQRSHFCTMGAIADVLNLGDWTRLRMWALAVAVVLLGFNAMVGLGWVEANNTIYGGRRVLWASAALGGALFGFGMVLASGCGSRALVRLGGGNLKALVVLLVLGLSAWMTLRGIGAVARVATVDRLFIELPVAQDLPSLVAHAGGWSRRSVAPLLGGVLGLALGAWALADAQARRGWALAGGLGIGAVVLAVWWCSGVWGYLPEHPQTLEPAFLATASAQRMESLSFVSPVAQTLELLTFWSDQSRHATLGIVATVGVAGGAFASAVLARRLRLEGFRDGADLRRHLVGATLMGLGGVTALGCTVGQGISGVSTLGLTSLVAIAAIIAGGVAGNRYLAWQLEREADTAGDDAAARPAPAAGLPRC